MAKYNIKHACGHDEVVDLCGKMEARENKRRWMESCDCLDCQAKK